MGYRLLADLFMVLHLGFISYVVLGGFLAWRWPAALVPHVLVCAWGASVVVFSDVLGCPLTRWEDQARRAAGEEGLPPSGFIDHYLDGVVYPEGNTRSAQMIAAVVVLVSWIVAYRRFRALRREQAALSARRSTAEGAGHQ